VVVEAVEVILEKEGDASNGETCIKPSDYYCLALANSSTRVGITTCWLHQSQA
tara:strand:- start:438 stop:596 length:159 start_codon:yes stop_codon:yes gene_type:complete